NSRWSGYGPARSVRTAGIHDRRSPIRRSTYEERSMNMKKCLIGGGIASAIGAIVVACGGGGGGSSGDPIFITKGTAIQNVTVVNTRDGSLARNMAVVVDDGKVTQVTSRGVKVSGTAVEVDGAGKYIVPGFNDMH